MRRRQHILARTAAGTRMSLARSDEKAASAWRRRSCGDYIPAPGSAHALHFRRRPCDGVLRRGEKDHRVALAVEADFIEEELERERALCQRDGRVVGL